MKYICASCKNIYDEKELGIDPMSEVKRCPKCYRLGSGIYNKEKLLDTINYYKELYNKLDESSENE